MPSYNPIDARLARHLDHCHQVFERERRSGDMSWLFRDYEKTNFTTDRRLSGLLRSHEDAATRHD